MVITHRVMIMNGKAAKRIRMGAMAMWLGGHAPAGATPKALYRHLKKDYLRKPYHRRTDNGFPIVSHKLRMIQRKAWAGTPITPIPNCPTDVMIRKAKGKPRTISKTSAIGPSEI